MKTRDPNAPKHHQVKVLPEDYLEGKANDSKRCPVAEAVKRTVSDWIEVNVTAETITIDRTNGYRYAYKNPGIASQAVLGVDDISYIPGKGPSFKFNLDARACTWGPTPTKKTKRVNPFAPKRQRASRIRNRPTTRIRGYLAPSI